MKPKRFETTKIVMLVMTSFLALLTAIFSCIAIIDFIRFADTSLISILIPCIFTELASYTGWYCWKARSENKLKIILGFIDELSQEDIEGKEELLNNLISNL